MFKEGDYRRMEFEHDVTPGSATLYVNPLQFLLIPLNTYSLTASSLAGVDASFSDQAFVNMATSAPDKVAAMPSQATNTSIPS